MRYAEVSVNSPIAQRRTFSYAIPPGLDIEVGQAVWVPFGDKRLQGIVLELSPHPSVEETKEIAGGRRGCLSWGCRCCHGRGWRGGCRSGRGRFLTTTDKH